MLETLKSLILDFQENELKPSIPRQLEIASLPGKATVCIGVRRSGKSTIMFQLMRQLLSGGVSMKNVVYINFFDDRLYPLQHEKLEIVLEAYYSMYPEKKNTETVYFFFDEIQMIPIWEPFVERILRTENCEVYITGSSAQMLSKEIASQMRGRAITWELFPFSFKEFLGWKGIDCQEPLSSTRRFFIQQAFAEYCETGGFPEVRNVEKKLRIKIHQEYVHAILFRDLIERHDISHPKAVSDLAYWFADNITSSYSINGLTGYLQSLGYKITKAAVAQYIAWFEDAYFFFSVRIFDASLKKANANPKKIYCIDSSLISSVASGVLVNSGHLLENTVFVALRRNYPAIFYYKTKNGREVDFLAQDHQRTRVLVQVCESIKNEKTREREVGALQEAMAELKLSSGTIVTRNEEGEIDGAVGTISIVPAWRFLLSIQT
jgi:uncharacterized protein